MNIYKAKDLNEALLLVSQGKKVMAGCTNLYVDFKKKGYTDEDYADISGLAELKKITADGETRIGALVTFADILEKFDSKSALYQAAYDMGSPQIRNRATIGGNICDASPACDAGPVLLVMNASAVLCSASGSRTVPMCEFFKGPRKTEIKAGEILTEIIIPDEPGKSVFRKVGLRNALAISVASLAAKETADGMRLAMGSVAEKPVRLLNCEKLTKEKQISAEKLKEALALDIHPISDVRASGHYRREVSKNLLADVLKKEFGYEII